MKYKKYYANSFFLVSKPSITHNFLLFYFLGLFLECPGTTAVTLRSTLQVISSPIHSLSVFDFDRSVTSLSQDMFMVGVHIRHLQFSHSHLQMLKDNSLKNLRATLESLSIVNGKLLQVRYNLMYNIFSDIKVSPCYHE